MNAVSTSAAPNIVYFVVQAAEYSIPLWLGSVSFDSGAATKDFVWLTTPLFYVTQGSSATEKLTLNRMGGSNGKIQFAAAGLPPNVTASFSPNPATGVEFQTDLTLTAAGDAAVVSNSNFTLSATPVDATAGPSQRTATGQLNILPPLQLSVPGPSTLGVLPCTPLGIGPMYVNPGPGFVGTISLSIVGLPANASYTITPSSFQSTQNPLPLIYAIIQVSGGLRQPVDIHIRAQSGALISSVPLTLQPERGTITQSPAAADAPKTLRPGDTISIVGTGFCPGSTVRFGNDVAEVIPASISPTHIQAVVPRYATTGLANAVPFPFGVIPPNGDKTSLIPAPVLCSIDSFRNTIGLPFENFDYGTVTLGQVTELFGGSGGAAKIFAAAAQLFVNAGKDCCFGMCLTTQRMYQDNTGALAASFPPNLPQLAFGLNSPDDNGGPSAPLQDYIRSQHLAQISNEYLGAYLTFTKNNLNASSGIIRQAIAACLQRTLPNGSQPIPYPDYPLVSMRQGLGSGHVVVAYDIVDGANGDFDVLVYDPNDPFTPVPSTKDSQGGEDSDATGQAHKYLVDHCTIHVTGDGHWTYQPQNDSGTVDELVPLSSTIIPLHPTMLGTTADLVVAGTTISLAEAGLEIGATFGPLGAIVGGLIGAVAGFFVGLLADLGSLIHFDLIRQRPGTTGTHPRLTGKIHTVQLSNHFGQILYGPDGAPNQDCRTRLSATPFAPLGGFPGAGEVFIVAKGDRYRHTVVGTAAGPYGMVLHTGSCIVVLSTSTSVGQNDEITFDTLTGTLGFRTDADSVPVTVEVLVQLPDGSVRLAALATTSTSLAREAVHFNMDCTTVGFAHHGPAVSYALVLGNVDSNGKVVTFYSGLRQIQDGQLATFTRLDWSSLQQVTFTTEGALTTEILAGKLLPGFKA